MAHACLAEILGIFQVSIAMLRLLCLHMYPGHHWPLQVHLIDLQPGISPSPPDNRQDCVSTSNDMCLHATGQLLNSISLFLC